MGKTQQWHRFSICHQAKTCMWYVYYLRIRRILYYCTSQKFRFEEIYCPFIWQIPITWNKYRTVSMRKCVRKPCASSFQLTQHFWIDSDTKESFTLRRQHHFFYKNFLYAIAITMWTLQLVTLIPIFAIAIAIVNGNCTHLWQQWQQHKKCRCRHSVNEP